MVVTFLRGGLCAILFSVHFGVKVIYAILCLTHIYLKVNISGPSQPSALRRQKKARRALAGWVTYKLVHHKQSNVNDKASIVHRQDMAHTLSVLV